MYYQIIIYSLTGNTQIVIANDDNLRCLIYAYMRLPHLSSLEIKLSKSNQA